jgi:demethylsterigmatocystin 6-O-methyltransferase
MDAIVDQIKSLAQGADEAQRKQILVSLREVSDSIESPNDTLQRLIYLVSVIRNWLRWQNTSNWHSINNLFQGLPLCMIRVGLDLDLFQLLVKNKSPASVSELATKTGAAPTLLGDFNISFSILRDT